MAGSEDGYGLQVTTTPNSDPDVVPSGDPEPLEPELPDTEPLPETAPEPVP